MSDITDHQDLNEKHDKLIVKYNQLVRDLTSARAEIEQFRYLLQYENVGGICDKLKEEVAALKAENERLAKLVDRYKLLAGAIAVDACSAAIAKHDDELVDECIAHFSAKVARLAEAEGIVADLAALDITWSHEDGEYNISPTAVCRLADRARALVGTLKTSKAQDGKDKANG
jgi:uncharacterized protein YdcH (DUF465 family)